MTFPPVAVFYTLANIFLYSQAGTCDVCLTVVLTCVLLVADNAVLFSHV